MAEILTARLLYAMNSPVYRAAYTQLFINHQFFGAFVALEEVGESFVKSRFTDDSGALFKSRTGFQYLGPDWNREYADRNQFSYGDEKLGQEKFIELSLIISQTTAADVTKLEQILDCELFLRTFVAEVVTGNYDGCIGSNNMYLYYHPIDANWKYFRYDLDHAFEYKSDVDFSSALVWGWPNAGPWGNMRCLPAQILMNNTKWRPRYIELMTLAIDYVASDKFTQGLVLQHQFLQPLLSLDNWRGVDDYPWNYTYWESQLPWLQYYFENRVSTARQQLANPPPT